jgi:uncharacterized protein
MRQVPHFLLPLFALALPFVTGAQQPRTSADRLPGIWTGALNVGPATLRLQLTVRRDSTGALAGTMKSLDQGGAEFVASVTAPSDSLSFVIPSATMSYSGAFTPTGDSIRGTFVQGRSFPLTFVRSNAPAADRRPQDPVPPLPYRTQDVTIQSAPGVSLAGTLDLPPGKGPFPFVVFVTGSGPQDRDEAIMGHRPFLVIADYLARHGIASLRYDDRGTAESTGSFSGSTSVDFAVDADAAVRFVKAMPTLASKVGIIGHSEGGLIGPMVAARWHDVDFLVLLAGTGVPGDSVAMLQTRVRAVASGAPPDQIARGMATNRRLFDAVVKSSDSADAVARLAIAKREALALVPEDRRAVGAQQIDKMIPQLVDPWFRYFMRYDPRDALRQIRVPVLALGGTLDVQVPAKENLPAIDAALKQAGNRDNRVVELPGLNHLFQTAKTGDPAEYAAIDETVSPQVLELVAAWINQRFR